MDDIEGVKPEGVSFSTWVKQACREKIVNEAIDDDVCVQYDNDTRLEVRTRTDNNSEAINRVSTLELIKRWEDKGLYHQQIAEKLNELGRESPSNKPWSRVLVRLLLNQKTMK